MSHIWHCHYRQKSASGESMRYGGFSVSALVVGFASPSLFGVTLHYSMLDKFAQRGQKVKLGQLRCRKTNVYAVFYAVCIVKH